MIGTCQICGEALGDRPHLSCSACGTPHHKDCWLYVGGCSTYACENAKTTPLTGSLSGKEGSKKAAVDGKAKRSTCAVSRRPQTAPARTILLPGERPYVVAGRLCVSNAFFIAALAAFYGFLPLALLGVVAFVLGLFLQSLRRRWAFDLSGKRLCSVRSIAGLPRLVQAIPLYEIATIAMEAKENDATRQRLHAILGSGAFLPLSGWTSSQEEVKKLRAFAVDAAKASGLPLRPGVIWKLQLPRRGKSALDDFALPAQKKGRTEED